MSLSLWHRLAFCFTVLLVTCFVAAGALQMTQSLQQGQRVEQRLLRHLAGHIAAETRGMGGGAQGPDPALIDALAARLQQTNPGIELYVLDALGRIQDQGATGARLQRSQVDLQPVRDFIAGKPLPLLGDDPLSSDGRKVFSAAVWSRDGAPAVYVYAVLQGMAYDVEAGAANNDAALRVALWSVGLVTPLGLLAGLAAFRLVTRPLVELTREVERLERHSRAVGQDAGEPGASSSPASRDEIEVLRAAFARLVETNASQRERLALQDHQRREMIANLSHDLRTPLASLQGYLETLLLKSSTLTPAEQDHYLRTAHQQCQSVSRLARELLDLARLELGIVKPASERFSIVELVHDVVHKLALASEARRQRIEVRAAPMTGDVLADIGMIERVLTNLLDNAIRHSPDGGSIVIDVAPAGDRVQLQVADCGPGMTPAARAQLLISPADRRSGHGGSGLGLVIVQQIVRLHGDELQVADRPSGGAVFTFGLPAAAVP